MYILCQLSKHLRSESIYSLLCPTMLALPALMHFTASFTNSSTISFADFSSLTTADALPIKNGRALSIISSDISSPMVSKSCSTGILPLSVRSLMSAWRFSSQFLMYSFERTRSGRPVKMMVRTLSSKPAERTASLWALGAVDVLVSAIRASLYWII